MGLTVNDSKICFWSMRLIKYEWQQFNNLNIQFPHSHLIDVAKIVLQAIYPVCPSSVSPIINVEMIVAVHVKPLKLQEELLKDGLCLEGDDAVLVPLVPALQHHPVHRPWNVGHEVPILVLAANLPNWNFCEFIRTMKWNFDKSKHSLSRFQL